jgi:hypothetical protein
LEISERMVRVYEEEGVRLEEKWVEWKLLFGEGEVFV